MGRLTPGKPQGGARKAELEADLTDALRASDDFQRLRGDLADGNFVDLEYWVQNDSALMPISIALDTLVEIMKDRLEETS